MGRWGREAEALGSPRSPHLETPQPGTPFIPPASQAAPLPPAPHTHFSPHGLQVRGVPAWAGGRIPSPGLDSGLSLHRGFLGVAWCPMDVGVCAVQVLGRAWSKEGAEPSCLGPGSP